MKLTFMLCIWLPLTLYTCERLALVISPVADVIGHPYLSTNICAMPVVGSAENCPRMHQVIFNETVTIVRETDHAYHMRLSQLFYITDQSKKKHDTYWIEKKHIMPLDLIPAAACKKAIPPALSYAHRTSTTQTVITLQKPWYSSDFGQTFSVGTRFIACGKAKRVFYRTFAWHAKKQCVITLRIPASYCITFQDKTHAYNTYVQLLKAWAHTPGYIPYVWGGCSFTDAREKEDLHCKHGFDCAGLIARAAQAAGIPYYYKNTFTLATFLKPVQVYADLRAGDLIWIPGHVMAVADMHKGTLIEARHYNQGYGKVHEIELCKVFKNIRTYRELFQAVQNRTVLERLDSTGKSAQRIANIKLLSMASCREAISF